MVSELCILTNLRFNTSLSGTNFPRPTTGNLKPGDNLQGLPFTEAY
jgi:hypothetical protein